MNILVFNWRDIRHPQAGGAELHLFEMAKIWVKRGNKVTVFSGAFAGCKRKETIDGIEVIRAGGRFTVYIHAALEYILNFRGKYDIVVDDVNGVPFFTPLFVSRPKLAIMHHLVGDIFFKELPFPFSWAGYLSEIYIMPVVYSNTKFIAVSKTSKDELVRAGFRKENIEVIYNGIDSKYRPSEKKSEAPMILYVGRVKRYKRLDILVRSMGKIVKELPQAKLFIVGEGDMKAEIEGLVQKLKLGKNIIFKGFISDDEKIKMLQSAWVFVTTSEKEGWGLSVLEANACGTPAVAFDVPGLNEAIINGVTGIIVQDNNTLDLEKSIVKILSNKTMRDNLRRNAINHAKSFSWDKGASEFLRIMDSKDLYLSR